LSLAVRSPNFSLAIRSPNFSLAVVRSPNLSLAVRSPNLSLAVVRSPNLSLARNPNFSLASGYLPVLFEGHKISRYARKFGCVQIKTWPSNAPIKQYLWYVFFGSGFTVWLTSSLLNCFPSIFRSFSSKALGSFNGIILQSLVLNQPVINDARTFADRLLAIDFRAIPLSGPSVRSL
jgi:hypothetical protein